MSLLSDSTVQRIFTAIKATTDTFLKVSTEVFLKKQNLSVMQETPQAYESVTVLGMRVASGDKNAAFDGKGALDNLGSYILYNYKDLETAGLASNGEVNIKPNRDKVKLEGTEYRINSVVVVGFLVNQYSVVKVFISKML
jgi:hypothetical protein